MTPAAEARGFVAPPPDRRYTSFMSLPLHVVTTEAMALDPADRLRLAAELLDSVEEPADAGWATAWSAELDLRVAEAERTGDEGRPWDAVRADLLRDLARR